MLCSAPGSSPKHAARRGRRMEERALAEGRGPDPMTRYAMKGGFIFDDDLFPLR